jgi:hypothetical protein
MNIESDPHPIEISMPFPSSRWGRLLYALFITILPFFSFWLTLLVKPDWQSGKLSDYAILFLSPEASLFVLPLLTYSIVCYLLLLINTSRFAPLFLIRFGIYTGVLLALHYSIAVLLALEPSPWLFLVGVAWILPLSFPWIYKWVIKDLSIQTLKVSLVILIVVFILVDVLFSINLLIFLLIFALIVAPFWSFLLSARTAFWLVKNHEYKITLWQGLGFSVWLAVYAGALRFNILKMHELYAALPPQPPCYVATAASQGHPHIVRSWPVHLKNGNTIQVNSQLQHFKSIEFAMMAISPKLHVCVRSVYDVVGKGLAAYLKNPLLADVAFLLLLPVEWISFRLLKFFVPEIEVFSKKIYHS